MPCRSLPSIEEIAVFHGRICPGLVLGYRAAIVALDWLDDHRSEDEEVIAIVENQACGIDAIQYLLGTTAGKGNFFIKDYGKHVYTVANRDTGKAIRIAVKTSGSWVKEGETKDERAKRLLDVPAEDLFETREESIDLPPKAEVLQSVICDSCNEPAMETKIRLYKGKKLCIPCFDRENSR